MYPKADRETLRGQSEQGSEPYELLSHAKGHAETAMGQKMVAQAAQVEWADQLRAPPDQGWHQAQGPGLYFQVWKLEPMNQGAGPNQEQGSGGLNQNMIQKRRWDHQWTDLARKEHPGQHG
jgi:hypothetical protein